MNTASETGGKKTNHRYTYPQKEIQIFNLKLSKFIHGENSYRIPFGLS